MTDADLWNSMDPATREALAKTLATEGVTFTGLDEQGHARFLAAGRPLVLVPGGHVQLGWAGGPLALTPEQRGAWRAGLADLWGMQGTPEDLLAENYGPLRTTAVPSLLVQVTPDPVDADDYFYDDDGDELDGEPYALFAAALAAEGFRLATGDEWEALYRGGTTTLFPWGDTWPSAAPYGASTPTFADHPLGLRFNGDPYWTELVADGLRGGDGGTDLCGGVPDPVAWRSLGCAYRPPEDLWTELLEESLECGLLRRVRTVRLGPV